MKQFIGLLISLANFVSNMKPSVLVSANIFCVILNCVTQIRCRALLREVIANVSAIHPKIDHMERDLILFTEHNESLQTTDLRIVGGDLVKIETYPWIVSLLLYGRHVCGGSIISSKRVLTAAHCILKTVESRYQVYAGSENLRTHSQGQIVSVSRIIIHPNYNDFANDISIVILASELKMSSKVAVVNLPKSRQTIDDGTMVQVAGWGTTSENGFPSEALRAVIIPTIGNNECAKMYYLYPITKAMVCAGFKAGGKDACQADSGGPLTLNKTLIGIVSWGYGCSRPNKPGVYTRVASFTKWIKRNM